MRLHVFALAFATLCSCAAGHAPDQRANKAIIPEPSPPVPPPKSDVVLAAISAYEQVNKREIPAIRAATNAEIVKRITRADLAARAALQKMTGEDGHLTEATVKEAQEAHNELVSALRAATEEAQLEKSEGVSPIKPVSGPVPMLPIPQ